MTEYAILSVLMCYRKYFQYNELKNRKKWNQISPYKAEEFKITVLGYGNIAKNIVKELLRFGFKSVDIDFSGGPFSCILYYWDQALQYIPENKKF